MLHRIKLSLTTVKQFNGIVVSLVACFTLVLEANCIRQPVSLLFPPLFFYFEIRKGGGNNKQTTSLLVLYKIILQVNNSVVNTTNPFYSVDVATVQ